MKKKLKIKSVNICRSYGQLSTGLFSYGVHFTYITYFTQQLAHITYTVFIARQHSYAGRSRYCYRKSVCLSVCPSVTRWYRIETNAHIVKLFLPSGKGMTLVFETYRHYKIPTGTPSVRASSTRGWEKCDLRQKSPFYFGNGTR